MDFPCSSYATYTIQGREIILFASINYDIYNNILIRQCNRELRIVAHGNHNLLHLIVEIFPSNPKSTRILRTGVRSMAGSPTSNERVNSKSSQPLVLSVDLRRGTDGRTKILSPRNHAKPIA